MSERALRGTRLGATSYETDSGIDLAPRQDVEYACPNGHRFQMPFSVEAEVPMVWECRVCGAQALRAGGTAEEDKPAKPARTHWDMLLERRSIPELEEVLAERLALLRDGGFGGRRSVHTAPPVNLSTGAPEPGAGPAAAVAVAEAEAPAEAGATRTAAKKTTAKKKTAGTAPAKKAATSKPAPAPKAADRPARKTAAKKP